MDKKSLINSINDFFDVVHSDMENAERIRALIRALDFLAIQYHQIEPAVDESNYPDIEPPKRTFEKKYDATYQMIGRQFPNLGYYNEVDEINDKIAETKISIGDAIDDLTDIYNELKNVMWYFDNSSDNHALSYFEMSYRTHWEKHLRGLQLCLYDWKNNN